MAVAVAAVAPPPAGQQIGRLFLSTAGYMRTRTPQKKSALRHRGYFIKDGGRATGAALLGVNIVSRRQKHQKSL